MMSKNSNTFGICISFISIQANASWYEGIYADIAKSENVSTLQVKETLETNCTEIDTDMTLFDSCYHYKFISSEIELAKIINTMPKENQVKIKRELPVWKKQRDKTCAIETLKNNYEDEYANHPEYADNPELAIHSYKSDIHFNSCREAANKERTEKLWRSK